MALDIQYTAEFLRLWDVYPKWPKRRSVKKTAFDAFEKAQKRLEFTDDDIEQIRLRILEQVTYDEQWQQGNRYGPPAFSTYFNQLRWNEPYQRVIVRATHVSRETRSSEPVDLEARRRAFERAKQGGFGLSK